MMVAELVVRGQTCSPINGEIPCLMPSSQHREASSGASSASAASSGAAPVVQSYLGELLAPTSPGSANGDSNGPYHGGGGGHMELSAHMKRKELFSQRKQREFIPENKKDDHYWDRRRRNNEAAKRSREKRRFNDMVLEQRVVELTKENHLLKAQLEAIREEFGLCGSDAVASPEKLMADGQVQALGLAAKRAKLAGTAAMAASLLQPAPVPTSVIHQPIVRSPLANGYHSHASPQQSPPQYHHQQPDPEPGSPYHSQCAGAMYHHHGHSQHQPYHPTYQNPRATHEDPDHAGGNNSALNLSRHNGRVRSPPYDAGSGDESSASQQPEPNNSLPLKLRHKSHLGDKDAAASALLQLQHIKQESHSRASPPWDAEGSSDERDSGISLGAEWSHTNSSTAPANSAAAAAAAAVVVVGPGASASAMRHHHHHSLHHHHSRAMAGGLSDEEAVDPADTKVRLHSEIARLSTEVDKLKSLMIKSSAAAP